ncbi:UDP-N-acetylglucosamine 2-epimerase [Uliginosibacterium sp. H1]|uniref:UDP-N-acetylglucosamine 2-epimerase n=1 Tax=Uliginosibacterium sp. H1 TaxID=3114757 RepID=UPI002E199D15|nr:UDP-N-acetylglucosamine 2-epimerase [Uliginosibacterium sp. H1]
MTTPRKIAVVTATRAEYGLLYWLMKALQADPAVALQVIVSGAHLSDRHGLTVQQIEADGFDIAARVVMDLGDDSPAGVTRSLGHATIGFAEALQRLQPDLMVILGDRYELLAAAQAALLARVPVAHIHGGETTEGAVDDAVRHALTKLSHLHFVAAEDFRRRVIQMGEAPERVFVVGATGLDNIAQLPLLGEGELAAQLDFPLHDAAQTAAPCFLVTYHPVTLGEDSAADCRALLAALEGFPGARIILTGANADPGREAVERELEAFAAARPDRVLLRASLGQLRYLSAMRWADVVVGNSSSGLLEAPAIGTPSVNVGERQRGRPCAPSVISCAATTEAIRDAVTQALSPAHRAIAAQRETPYGTPGAAQRIADVLRMQSLQGVVVKHFHDLP